MDIADDSTNHEGTRGQASECGVGSSTLLAYTRPAADLDIFYIVSAHDV